MICRAILERVDSMTGASPPEGEIAVWVERDLDLLDPSLRPRVRSLRDRLPRSGGHLVAEQVQLALAAAFVGDQAAAAACIDMAEELLAGILAARTAPPTSVSSKTIAHRGLTGSVPAPLPNGPRLVATDGSSDLHAYSGWAFISTDGNWGCQAGEYKSNAYDSRNGVNGNSASLIAELRAVYFALTTLVGRATVLTDSKAALRLLRSWQEGNVHQMPQAYSLRARRNAGKPTLVRLAELVAERRELAFTHVQGHNGHVLNEAADLLAGQARRWMARPQRLGLEIMTARGNDVASSFLATWRQEDTTAR